MSNKTAYSRRHFLAGAAAVGGVVTAEIMSVPVSHAQTAAKQPVWDAEADVVVIGSGMAGVIAAITAIDKGASVLMLEKMPVLGGNSNFITYIAAPGCALQKKHGIEDSPELHLKDMHKLGEGINHVELTRVVPYEVNASLELALKYGAPHGMQLKDKVTLNGGHSRPRCVVTENGIGKGFLAPLYEALKQSGKGKILTKCKVDSFIMNEEGVVVGVNARSSYTFNKTLRSDDKENTTGMPVRIRAEKAVIVASGGYSYDLDFRTMEQPLLGEYVKMQTWKGATGGVLRALMATGARGVHLTVRRVAFPVGELDTRWCCMVNPTDSQRIVNESLGRDQVASAILNCMDKNRGRPPIGIYDATTVTKVYDYKQRIGDELDKGTAFKFDSLAELAAKYGMDMKALQETLNTYNAAVDAGKDTVFGKSFETLQEGKLLQAPFYAVEFMPRPSTNPGGIAINAKGQVLHVLNDKPIPHLYAAGEVTGGVHGANQLASSYSSDCLAYGRIAVEQALS